MKITVPFNSKRIVLILFCLIFVPSGLAYAEKDVDGVVHEHLSYNWPITFVATIDGQMRIRTGIKRINDATYQAIISATCLIVTMEEASMGQVREIAVLNSFGAQGYVYEDPGMCPDMAEEPIGKLELFILQSTHLF